MRKISLLSSILLLSAMWAFAQYGNQPSTDTQQSSGMSSQTSSEMGKSATIQGCLSESDGNYTLTDQAGTTYQLTGDTAQLHEHIGHTIQVTGTSAANMSEMDQSHSMSAPAGEPQQFHVTSFKHISGHCMH